MVEHHLLLPSVYVFLLLEVNIDQRDVPFLHFAPARCCIHGCYERRLRLRGFSMLELCGVCWWQITLPLIFENMCGLLCLPAHFHMKDFTGFLHTLAGAHTSAPCSRPPIPSQFNTKAFASHRFPGNPVPPTPHLPAKLLHALARPLLLINVISACQRLC